MINLIAKNAALKSGDNRRFILGVGEDVSHALVEGMARAGKGTCEYVRSEENMNAKVMKLLFSSTQPSVENIQIDWRFSDLFQKYSFPIVSQAPQKLSTLFSGNFCLVYALFDPNIVSQELLNSNEQRKIVVTADTPEGPLKVEFPYQIFPINQVQGNGNQIHSLAAKRLITELSESQVDYNSFNSR